MKNLFMLCMEGIDLLNDIGIYPNKISKFTINNRKTSLGFCQRQRFGGTTYYTISINKALLDDNISDKETMNTILHELLHSVDGCFSHTGKWKELADKVNREYGYHVSRTATTETISENLKSNMVKDRKIFVVKCSNCGMEYKQEGYRSPKWYAHCDRYHCTECKSKLIRL